MKVLSIRQPWADLIVRGIKRIENRTWNTKYRGPILIHAALRYDESISAARASWKYPNAALTRGAIVGSAELIDVVTESDDPFFEGPFGFVLDNVQQLSKPLPLKGKLGLFEIDRPISMAIAPGRRGGRARG